VKYAKTPPIIDKIVKMNAVNISVQTSSITSSIPRSTSSSITSGALPARANSIIGVYDVEDDYLWLVHPIFSSGLMPGSSSAGEGRAWMAVRGPSDPARFMASTTPPFHPWIPVSGEVGDAVPDLRASQGEGQRSPPIRHALAVD